MARNGSGVYVLPPSNPVAAGTVIESTWANDTMSDIANALTQSIAVDGQTVPTANLQMGGFHHTNVSDPNLRSQYATLGMVQDGRHTRVQITGGVDNLIGTLIGGATAYVAGSLVTFFAPATNTGSMTLNYNGIGARSLTDQNGLPLAPGEISAGEFVLALYTGTEFRLLTSVDAAAAADLYNLSITGQVRPPSNIYPSLTIATGTTINVPAGSAWIVPPGNDTDNSELVSWSAQTITLQYLASSFTTVVVVDNNGVIQQISGRAVGANFRNYAVLGVVEHIGGVANQVITRPAIFGDDGYRNRDVVSLLANTIINGGLVQPNAISTLNLDVAQGTVFIPGGTANTVDSPNTFNIPPQQNIQFRPLAGQNTLSALTSTVPVGSYDANGAGVVAALPNPGDATIHRLFYVYGQYVLAYGQQVYTSVENALSMIEWDRTKFKKSIYLSDATLMAEVIAVRTATNLNLIAQGAVVCPGGLNFSIGSPGGISEAPIDGTPYGRRNAAWFQVLGSVSPAITTDATITGAAPKLNLVVSPYGAGTSGFNVFAGANKWFGAEIVNPDDKMYFRSYNPASGALRFTTVYDLATGQWTFSVPPTVTTPNLTDFTPGLVMTVGSGGFAGDPAIVSAAGALNDLINVAVSRLVRFSSANAITVGAPIATGGVVLHVANGSSAVNAAQEYISITGTTTRKFVRHCTAGAWQPWIEVLKQGDYGLGLTDTVAVADLNGLTNTGVYFAATSTLNIPVASSAFMVLHMNNNPNSATQFAIRAQSNPNPHIYFRSKSSGAWGGWQALFGQAQTWQNVTGSRAGGVTYTNNTMRPIQVNITVGVLGGQTAYNMVLLVDGVNVAQTSALGQASGQGNGLLSAIVPVGSSYSLFVSAGGIGYWAELR